MSLGFNLIKLFGAAKAAVDVATDVTVGTVNGAADTFKSLKDKKDDAQSTVETTKNKMRVLFNTFKKVIKNALTHDAVYLYISAFISETGTLTSKIDGVRSFGLSRADELGLTAVAPLFASASKDDVSNIAKLHNAVVNDLTKIEAIQNVLNAFKADSDLANSKFGIAMAIITFFSRNGEGSTLINTMETASLFKATVKLPEAPNDTAKEAYDDGLNLAVGLAFAAYFLETVCKESTAPFIRLKPNSDKLFATFKNSSENSEDRMDFSGFGSEKYLTGKGASFEDCLRIFSNQLIFKNTLVYSL